MDSVGKAAPEPEFFIMQTKHGAADTEKVKQAVQQLFLNNPILQANFEQGKFSQANVKDKKDFFEVTFDDKYRVTLKKVKTSESQGIGEEITNSEVVLIEKLRTTSFSKSISQFFRGVLAFFYKPYLEISKPTRGFDDRTSDHFKDLLRSLDCGKKWVEATSGKEIPQDVKVALEQIDSTIQHGQKIASILKQPSSKREKAFEALSTTYASEISNLQNGKSLIIPSGYVAEERLQPLFLKFSKDEAGKMSLTVYSDQSLSESSCLKINRFLGEDEYQGVLKTFFSGMIEPSRAESEEQKEPFQTLLKEAKFSDEDIFLVEKERSFSAPESALHWISLLGASKEENVSLLYRLTEDWIRSTTKQLDFLPKNEQKTVIEECLNQIEHVSKNIAVHLSDDPNAVTGVPPFLQEKKESLESRLKAILKDEKLLEKQPQSFETVVKDGPVDHISGDPILQERKRSVKNRLEDVLKNEKSLDELSKSFEAAAKDGSVDHIKELLKELNNIEEPRQRGVMIEKAFSVACKHWRFDTVYLLLDHAKSDQLLLARLKSKTEEMIGHQINSCDDKGRTLLGYASEAGSSQIVDMLIELGAKKGVKDEFNKMPYDYVKGIDEELASKLRVKEGEIEIDDTVQVVIQDPKKSALSDLVIENQSEEPTIDLELVAPSLEDILGTQWKSLEEAMGLIKSGVIAVDERNVHGLTALQQACRSKNTEDIKFLVKKGADINRPDKDGVTPFMYICWSKEFDEAFIKALPIEPKIKCSDKNGMTPLLYACQPGRAEVIKWLISKGADINTPNKMGMTPFMHICKLPEFDPAFVQRQILKPGMDVNKKVANGMTAIQYACEAQRDDVIKLLLKAGADINQVNPKGETPFMYICSSEHFDIDFISDLIPSIIDINKADKEGMTALHYACKSEKPNLDIIQALIQQGADINLPNELGETPFMFLCGLQKVDANFIENILPQVDDINAPDSTGMTPLHYAYQTGTAEVVRLLLENNADIYLKDNQDHSIHYFLQTNKLAVEIMEVLKDLRPGFFLPTIAEVFEAFSNGDLAMVDRLQEENGLEIVDHEGRTLLMMACEIGATDVAEKLLEYDADIYAVDDQGKNPYVYAVESGNSELEQLIGRKIFIGAINGGVFSDIQNLVMNRTIEKDTVIEDGKTALMLAVELRDIRVIRLLVGEEEIGIDSDSAQVFKELKDEEEQLISQVKEAIMAIDISEIKDLFYRIVEERFPTDRIWNIAVKDLKEKPQDAIHSRFAEKVAKALEVFGIGEQTLDLYQMLKIAAIAECHLENPETEEAIRLTKASGEQSHSLLVDVQRQTYTILLNKALVGEGASAKVKAALEISAVATEGIRHFVEELAFVPVVQKVSREEISAFSAKELEYQERFGDLRTWTSYQSKTGIEKMAYTTEAFSSDLFSVIQNGVEGLEWKEKLQLLLPIVEDLRKMHDEGVIHGDIKPENILFRVLNGQFQAKLTDFGYSYAPEREDKPSGDDQYGTISYTSPEVLQGSLGDQLEDHKLQDVYAFGGTAVELFFGLQFGRDADGNIVRPDRWYEQNKDIVLSQPPTIEELTVQCLCKLLDPDLKKRITVDTFINEIQALQDKFREI